MATTMVVAFSSRRQTWVAPFAGTSRGTREGVIVCIGVGGTRNETASQVSSYQGRSTSRRGVEEHARALRHGGVN